MGRAPRADEAGGIYHALNRGNAKHPIFFKDADYEAFERIIAEGLGKFPVELIAYQWMNNHWHMVLSPNEDGGMGEFWDGSRCRTPSDTTPTMERLDLGMSTRDDSKAFPFRPMHISMSSAATSSEMLSTADRAQADRGPPIGDRPPFAGADRRLGRSGQADRGQAAVCGVPIGAGRFGVLGRSGTGRRLRAWLPGGRQFGSFLSTCIQLNT